MTWKLPTSNKYDSIINGVDVALNSVHDLSVVRLICNLTMTETILVNYGLRLKKLRRNIIEDKRVDKDFYRSLFSDRNIVLQVTRDIDFDFGDMGIIRDFIVKYNYDLEDFCEKLCNEHNLDYYLIFEWLFPKEDIFG